MWPSVPRPSPSRLGGDPNAPHTPLHPLPLAHLRLRCALFFSSDEINVVHLSRVAPHPSCPLPTLSPALVAPPSPPEKRREASGRGVLAQTLQMVVAYVASEAKPKRRASAVRVRGHWSLPFLSRGPLRWSGNRRAFQLGDLRPDCVAFDPRV